MARLPVVGSDNNSWGTVLNTFLVVSHNTDGTLIPSAVSTAALIVSTKTSNYSAGSSQSEAVLANASGGGFTVTLPTAAGSVFNYTIKKIDSSANNVTIATTSSQTIDGGTTALLKVQYASITVVSDGSNWQVI